MEQPTLTGSQKSYLRGLGQRLEPGLKLGREGLSATVRIELERLLGAHELVKIRFVDADREQRAAVCGEIERAVGCVCVGAVGHTALFFRRNADPALQQLELP